MLLIINIKSIINNITVDNNCSYNILFILKIYKMDNLLNVLMVLKL